MTAGGRAFEKRVVRERWRRNSTRGPGPVVNPPAAEPYNINLIPTQIFFDAGGKELWRHEGFFAKADILAKWKELGVGL